VDTQASWHSAAAWPETVQSRDAGAREAPSVELRASGGRLIYSRDDPEHEPSDHVNDLFKRIVDSRPAGIQLLEKAHPVAAAHGKQE
jgi:hypothetical protein